MKRILQRNLTGIEKNWLEKIDVGTKIDEEQKEEIYNMLLRTQMALSKNYSDTDKAKVTPHKK